MRYIFQDVYKTSNASKEYPVLIYDENKNLELELQIDDFLYAESSNQYVLIYYSNANSIKKHLVRARIKTIVKTLKHFPVEQCHRSYAINLQHVKSLIRKDGKTYLIINTGKDKGNCVNTTNSENYPYGYFRVTQVVKVDYTFQ